MNACLVGFLLLTSLQVSAQTFGNKNSCPQLVVASRVGEVELCRYSPSETSEKFNLTLEKGNEENVACLVYSLGTEHNWTDKTHCRVLKNSGTFSLSLINLEEKDAGDYICRIKILFPPPVTNSIVNRTLLCVHDFGVQPPACRILSFVETWVLIGVSVFLFACFMVVFINSKRKHCRECDARNMELIKEHNSEYMHMASVPLPRCMVR